MRSFFTLIFFHLLLNSYAQQPILIKDIAPGPASSTGFVTQVYFTLDSLYFFQVEDRNYGYELWKTDGTSEGTEILKNINPMGYDSLNNIPNVQKYLIKYKNIVYFYSNGSITTGTGGNIWRTDGTMDGTYKFFESCSSGCQSPTSFGIVNDKLVFTGTGADGDEIWVTDGTIDNTVLLKEINAGPGGSQPLDFHLFNGYIYFTATNGNANRELWRTDGTAAGTTLFMDVNGIDTTGSNPLILREVGGDLFFSAVGSVANGRELWKTDGSVQGTVLVKDINPGALNGMTSNSSGMVSGVLGDQLLFFADDGINGRELWTTNGESSGTYMLKDVTTGSGSTTGGSVLLSTDSFLLITISDNIHGNEIWRTNGTEVGTFLLKDIWEGSNGGAISSAATFKNTTLGNKVYFAAKDPVYGEELWVSDGTNAGTKRLTNMEFLQGAIVGGPRIINNYIYFTDATDEFGFEVWKMLIETPSGTTDAIHPENLSFSVYPNPNRGQFQITGNAAVPADVNVTLYDMQGKLVASQKFSQLSGVFMREMRVPNAPGGLYVLNLQTESANQTTLISIENK